MSQQIIGTIIDSNHCLIVELDDNEQWLLSQLFNLDNTIVYRGTFRCMRRECETSLTHGNAYNLVQLILYKFARNTQKCVCFRSKNLCTVYTTKTEEGGTQGGDEEKCYASKSFLAHVFIVLCVWIGKFCVFFLLKFLVYANIILYEYCLCSFCEEHEQVLEHFDISYEIDCAHKFDSFAIYDNEQKILRRNRRKTASIHTTSNAIPRIIFEYNKNSTE